MKMPFSTEQFFEVFRKYNLAIFPLQGVLFLVALFAVYFVAFPRVKSGRIVSGALAILWLWMGIAYHLCFFTSINKAAYGFGALFVIQALLFLYYGVALNKLTYAFHSTINTYVALFLLIYALLIYPLYGHLFGHKFPDAPTFGLPCPTTIFTLALLLTTKKYPLALLIIPLIWSVIGSSAAYSFGMVEDSGLAVTGAYSVFAWVFRNRTGPGKRLLQDQRQREIERSSRLKYS